MDADPTTLETIRSLVDEISLVPGKGRPRIEVRGKLSSILAMAGGAENARRGYGLTAIVGGGRRGTIKAHGDGNGCLMARQVKMVAETRNQRQLTLAEVEC